MSVFVVVAVRKLFKSSSREESIYLAYMLQSINQGSQSRTQQRLEGNGAASQIQGKLGFLFKLETPAKGLHCQPVD